MTGMDHLEAAGPGAAPNTHFAGEAQEDECGAKKGFLKMNNLEEAGLAPLISQDPAGRGQAGGVGVRGVGEGVWTGRGLGAIAILRSIFITTTRATLLRGVPGAGALRVASSPRRQSFWVVATDPTLWMRKLRFRAVERLAQGHTAGGRRDQDSNLH